MLFITDYMLYYSENMKQLREKASADIACRREETAIKRRKLCLQEQELIDGQLRGLRQELMEGLIEKEEYQQRARDLRARSDAIYNTNSQYVD